MRLEKWTQFKREYHKLWRTPWKKNTAHSHRTANLTRSWKESEEKKNIAQNLSRAKNQRHTILQMARDISGNAANLFDDPKGNKYQELEDRITELERYDRPLTMENEILKKAKNGWGQATGKTDHDRRTQSQLLVATLCKFWMCLEVLITKYPSSNGRSSYPNCH